MLTTVEAQHSTRPLSLAPASFGLKNGFFPFLNLFEWLDFFYNSIIIHLFLNHIQQLSIYLLYNFSIDMGLVVLVGNVSKEVQNRDMDHFQI